MNLGFGNSLEIRQDSPRVDHGFYKPWRFDKTHPGRTLGLTSLGDSTRDAFILDLARFTRMDLGFDEPLKIQQDSPRADFAFDEPL